MRAIFHYILNMSTQYEKTPIGERVARYRKLRGFSTPLKLAEAIPSSKITRSTIVNIEAGRKNDPSIADLMLIASGLRVPLMSLIIDIDEPFAQMAVDGLAEPYASMSVAEYIADSDVERGLDDVISQRTARAVGLLGTIRWLENAVFEHTYVAQWNGGKIPPEEEVLVTRPDGSIARIYGFDFSPGNVDGTESDILKQAARLASIIEYEKPFLNFPFWVERRSQAVIDYAESIRKVRTVGKTDA